MPTGVAEPEEVGFALDKVITQSITYPAIAPPIGLFGAPPAPANEAATFLAASTAFWEGERYSDVDAELTVTVETCEEESCIVDGRPVPVTVTCGGEIVPVRIP